MGAEQDIRDVAAAVRLPEAPPDPGRAAPVAELVRTGLHTRLRAVLAHDPGTRRDSDPEQLHQMRVSVRRMRAMLKSGRPFLDTARSEPLRAELGWLGRALGPVRDLDVLLARLDEQAELLPAAERAAAQDLLGGLRAERERARADLVAALDGERYLRLLQDAADAVRAGIAAPDSTADGARELRRAMRAQLRKVEEQVARLPTDPADEQLHALRIRGKRIRYTAELARPISGKPVRRLLKKAERFQDVLGAHQDACVTAHRVREQLATAGGDTAAAFAAGRLVERESARRAEQRARWQRSWRELRNAGRKL
ncbi:CHAD domain-containing protein [Saccharopolyspora sp. HNM0983]|uniref:CHAD domain-containing protein n=1 Tax=Saccharopolyspora montiporae TaxID=2781240 RepID=A0A929BDT9_9PSEU|nr:CHAD domain-containing protein [Saccharopolyspora sp. HNM0983]MBE9375672.1 CHAD domain-containing protein [Saccharopolyspora sp. HNM0983]